jgi:hypothetical protein
MPLLLLTLLLLTLLTLLLLALLLLTLLLLLMPVRLCLVSLCGWAQCRTTPRRRPCRCLLSCVVWCCMRDSPTTAMAQVCGGEGDVWWWRWSRVRARGGGMRDSPIAATEQVRMRMWVYGGGGQVKGGYEQQCDYCYGAGANLCRAECGCLNKPGGARWRVQSSCCASRLSHVHRCIPYLTSHSQLSWLCIRACRVQPGVLEIQQTYCSCPLHGHIDS